MNENEMETLLERLGYCELEYQQNSFLSAGKFEAIKQATQLIKKQNNKIQKIKQIVDIYNNTNREFATLPNGEEICLSDNEPIIAYLQEILEEEN